jgi:hypothetical protein
MTPHNAPHVIASERLPFSRMLPRVIIAPASIVLLSETALHLIKMQLLLV